MKKLYVAIVGKMAAGKGTFGNLLREEAGSRHTVSCLRFSDPLNAALEAVGVEKSRENQQWLSTELRKRFGEDMLGKVLQRMAEAEQSDVVFFDGVRRPHDVLMLRGLTNSCLIALEAPAEARFERLKKRNDRPGDAEKTWEAFQAENMAEAESRIETIAKQADLVIDNAGSIEDLRMQVRSFFRKYAEPV